MARPTQHPLQLLVVAFVTALWMAPSSFAQQTYVDVCREELNQLTPGSEDHLLVMLELTDALKRCDLAEALRIAIETKELAEQNDQPDIAMVALLDINCIMEEVSGETGTEITRLTNVAFTPSKLSAEAPPELQLHFELARLELNLWSSDWPAGMERHLQNIRFLAEECENARLKLYARTYDAYARAFRQDDTLTVVEQDRLSAQSHSKHMLDGVIVSYLLNAVDQEAEGRVEKLVAAAQLADESENLRFGYIALRMLATVQKDAKEYQKAKETLDRAKALAVALGSKHFQYDVGLRLAMIHKKLGNNKQYAEQLKKNIDSDGFGSKRVIHKDRIYRLAEHAHRNADEHAQANQYQGMQLPRSLLEEFKQSKSEMEHLGYALATKDYLAVKAVQQGEKFAGLAKDVQSQSHVFLATVLGFLGLATAIGLLFVHQRFTRVKDELETNEETTQRNRGIINQLTARMERMESLNRMAGGFAHDFNNIMVSVLSNAEVIQLKKTEEEDAFTLERVDGIIKSVEKATDLSQKMLAYAGRTSTSRDSVEVNQLIRDYESALQGLADENQTIEFELSDKPLNIVADPTQIEQAVLNLVSNSFVASAKHGRVVIRTGVDHIFDLNDSSLYGSRTTGGQFAFVQVIDYGKGIETENLHCIFDPFYTDLENHKGLGLSVVYGVVKNHDGLIQCKSIPRQRTSFRILLPLVDQAEANGEALEDTVYLSIEDTVRPDGHHASVARNPKYRSKVLVVDDEPEVKKLCKELLVTGTDYDIITAPDGVAGLKIIRDNHDDLHCVLMDVMMPGMGGEEVLQTLEAERLDVPVVLLTGYSRVSHETLESYPNVVELIEKPFRAKRIIGAIEQIAGAVG